MNSNFINPNITKASELGVGLYEDSYPVELFPHDSSEEIDIAILAIYRQVLGNVHLMERSPEHVRVSTPEQRYYNS